MNEIRQDEETFAIRGAVFEVYKHLRNGYLESVYQEALSFEFAERGIPFQAQPMLRIQYKDHLLEQFYKPDFVCYGKVVVELKAVRYLPDEATAQLLNYLATTKMPVGLLVNFGRPDGVEIKRFVR